jgi:hypothetical protein
MNRTLNLNIYGPLRSYGHVHCTETVDGAELRIRSDRNLGSDLNSGSESAFPTVLE